MSAVNINYVHNKAAEIKPHDAQHLSNSEYFDPYSYSYMIVYLLHYNRNCNGPPCGDPGDWTRIAYNHIQALESLDCLAADSQITVASYM